MPPRNTFFDYVKAAFLWRWNLLVVSAALAFGLLSGRPDVVWPLTAAAETAYLGLLSTHPRFRKSVDARFVSREGESRIEEQLQRVMSTLPPKDIKRFQMLRERCANLHRLGQQLKGPIDQEAYLSEVHVASLDRLLWTFLKLLYSRDALDRFLRNTDRAALVREIKETEAEVGKLRTESRKENLLRSLEDKVATMKARLTNYDAAVDNAELLQAELERIEQKVTAISEMSLSQADPGSISSQVDGITDSLSVTAEAIKTLDMVPTLQEPDRAPAFLSLKQR
ncbi:MAG: hypothetical protein AB1641_20535 [Thermodesulfobacteriota bacterium]